MKQHDTSPVLNAQIKSATTSQALDLTGASARFIMQDINGNELVSAPASIEPGVDGLISYYWQPGDTATAGTHNGEFEITFPNTLKETHPQDVFLEIEITEDLNDN